MSEAKPQDGSTVKCYRTLTTGDIERMNRLKDVSRHFCNLLDTEHNSTMDGVVGIFTKEESERNEALRCLDIARTKMQKACMWPSRAVARPDADC
ncbi:hypothetical protein FMJ45_06475 [Klebsiella michiganensis]|uniref:Acb2/Tad1 domain-containing protein n=1 Tax=Klebsiella TaxID=570 RepID=UPI001157E197|nr:MULTISPECIES: hypothetical protein [Klebsiella]MBF8470455.1 hypothetical protein [Klebsiella michiganensis]MBZ6600787.1 hypothetical protein [Klebsiella michiganensis]MBZ7451628.1 hypothetical protein [Klebsiella michiganensis]MBZ7661077.1 hypothetical protein [Klebsiella grimontii]VUS56240.1 hypothetical protein SB6424_00064 [Klebsiella pasteurii]